MQYVTHENLIAFTLLIFTVMSFAYKVSSDINGKRK